MENQSGSNFSPLSQKQNKCLSIYIKKPHLTAQSHLSCSTEKKDCFSPQNYKKMLCKTISFKSQKHGAELCWELGMRPWLFTGYEDNKQGGWACNPLLLALKQTNTQPNPGHKLLLLCFRFIKVRAFFYTVHCSY